MNLSVEDIVKEALLKGKGSVPAPKQDDDSEPAKLASALEAIASNDDEEAKAYAELTEQKNEKLASIKDFVETLAEVV
jgi:hypothetical protein